MVDHLDELGYDEVWVGEHHSTGWENIGSPEVFIAASAQRTQRIEYGTGVVQLGLHNPLVVLDRMIMLDHLTRGRTMFGVGIGGGLPSDLTVFGLDQATAGRRFAESLEVILELLDGSSPVSRHTDWFDVDSAVLQLRPYSRPHMTFAVASTFPENLELMGRLGGRVLLGPTPHLVPQVLEHLRRGAGQVGREASRDQIVLSYRMLVGDDTDNARDALRDGSITEHYDFNVAVNGRPAPESGADEWYQSFADQMLIGSADDVTAKMEEIMDVSGGVGGILFQPRDWAGLDTQRSSFEVFMSEVAPRFQ